MRTRIAAAALTTAALLSLTACNSDDSSKAKPSSTSATPSVDYSSINAAAGIPPEPTGAKKVALLAALKAINPALTEDPAAAIDNARNQCSTLSGGGDKSGHTAAMRFQGGSANPTDAQGQAINAALRATLCPQK